MYYPYLIHMNTYISTDVQHKGKKTEKVIKSIINIIRYSKIYSPSHQITYKQPSGEGRGGRRHGVWAKAAGDSAQGE